MFSIWCATGRRKSIIFSVHFVSQLVALCTIMSIMLYVNSSAGLSSQVPDMILFVTWTMHLKKFWYQIECPSFHGQVVSCLCGTQLVVTQPVVTPLHLPTSTQPSAVAAHDQAERKKVATYSKLDSSYLFTPVRIDTCGCFGPTAHELFRELGAWDTEYAE